MEWTSPDKKIEKIVISRGVFSNKPTEGSECTLNINCTTEDLTKFSKIVIGEETSDLGRLIEICVSTMFLNETSSFVIKLEKNIALTITLNDLIFAGYLYQWSPKQKINYAIKRKEAGTNLFSNKEYRAAAYCFIKALKIICSIPIDSEKPKNDIETVKVQDIDSLKANLYNNLASCFLKKEKWTITISYCEKVFVYDKANVKALYKTGVSYFKDKNAEMSAKYFEKLLKYEQIGRAHV